MPGLVDKLLEDDEIDLRDEIEAFGNVGQVFEQFGYAFNRRLRQYEKIFPLSPVWPVGEGDGRFEWTALRVGVQPLGPDWFVALKSGLGTPQQWRYEASWDSLGGYKLHADSVAPAATLRGVLQDIERLMENRQSYEGRVNQFVAEFKQTRPVVESVVAHLLEDDDAVDASDLVRAASMTEVDTMSIRELRSVFNGMGYRSSVYRSRRREEIAVSGTPTDPDRLVTLTDMRRVADRIRVVLQRSGVPSLEATVFGWNKKPPGVGVPDYETTGSNRIYVTIVNNTSGMFDNAVYVYGHVPESAEDDFDVSDALHGMTMSADEARELLPRLGYRPVRGSLYRKFIKTLESPKGPYDMSVFVSLVNDKAAFVFVGREAESTQRLGMANSWIKAFPSDLESFLSVLESTLRRYPHTDYILTFKAKHPEVALTTLDADTEKLW